MADRRGEAVGNKDVHEYAKGQLEWAKSHWSSSTTATYTPLPLTTPILWAKIDIEKGEWGGSAVFR